MMSGEASYDAGYDYGYKVADTMVVFQPLLAVPAHVVAEAFNEGYEAGFHARKTSEAENRHG